MTAHVPSALTLRKCRDVARVTKTPLFYTEESEHVDYPPGNDSTASVFLTISVICCVYNQLLRLLQSEASNAVDTVDSSGVWETPPGLFLLGNPHPHNCL